MKVTLSKDKDGHEMAVCFGSKGRQQLRADIVFVRVSDGAVVINSSNALMGDVFTPEEEVMLQVFPRVQLAQGTPTEALAKLAEQIEALSISQDERLALEGEFHKVAKRESDVAAREATIQARTETITTREADTRQALSAAQMAKSTAEQELETADEPVERIEKVERTKRALLHS